MRVHHLNCGTMCPRPAGLITTTGGGLRPARMVCHCLLVELRDGWALVDTGLGTADVADARGRLGLGFIALVGPKLDPHEPALAQLAGLGLKASDVRHVLPTHLDLDHAGGIPDFPHAEVHVLAREHEAATARKRMIERVRYKPAQFREARLTLHEAQGERWFGFEGVRPIAGSDDEVLIIPLHGHTFGHAGIAVRAERGWILHAGDAYFHHDEVHGSGRAPVGLEGFQRALAVDDRMRRANRKRLRELAQNHGGEVTVICAHDASELHAWDPRHL